MKNLEVFSFLSFGYEGRLVKVEADLKKGLPITEIVGLPGGAVKEARERVRVAIKNSQLEYPMLRVLINLSPASEKKEGSGFDLAIALAVLAASEKAEIDTKTLVMAIGELELSGRVRKVRGVLAAIFCGIKAGIKYFIVPNENYDEALIPGNCFVLGVDNLDEAFNSLNTVCQMQKDKKVFDEQKFLESCISEKFKANLNCSFKNNKPKDYEIIWSENIDSNYSEVKGQDELLFSLEVAAAGGHNLLAYGPPGCGKSLSLKKFQSLLPDLDLKTSEEVTRIYSIAGLLNLKNTQDEILIRRPPFRMPHQSASLEGIIGGAGKCLPGEISLSHGGVLFLDEATQFKASVLQSLRSPLETGSVTLSRAEKRTTYPARFQLLLAMNPCSCGNLGSENKFCTCSPLVIDRYWKKLTAPLLDRIDLRVFVEPPKSESLLFESETSTEKMRTNIKKAQEISLDRNIFYNKDLNFSTIKNNMLSPESISNVCVLTDEASRGFKNLFEKNDFSGRGSHAVLKVARTIADIEGLNKINVDCLERAMILRKFNPLLPDFL